MDTKQRIIDEALTLFSEKGYANVFVGDIAQAVGIKAPSLYKHYKSKKAIFEAIIDEMNRRFEEQAKAMQINGTDASKDAGIYEKLSEDQTMVRRCWALFRTRRDRSEEHPVATRRRTVTQRPSLPMCSRMVRWCWI